MDDSYEEMRSKLLAEGADYLDIAIDYLHETVGLSYTDIQTCIRLMRAHSVVSEKTITLPVRTLPIVEEGENVAETVLFDPLHRWYVSAEDVNMLLSQSYRVKKSSYGYSPLNPQGYSIIRGWTKTVEEAWFWCHQDFLR